jgi:hypothetical protein
VICCGGLRDEHLRRVMSAGEWGQLAPGLAYYRRGLEHLETLLNAGETWQERIGGGNFLTDFDGPFWASSRLPKDAPPEVHTAMQEMLSLREETYFRIGVRRARERQPDRYWFSWVTFGRPLPERLAVAERMLGALADTPLQTELVSAELTTAVQEMSGKLPPVSDRVASRPEFQSFLAKLERDSAAGQAIARETRRRIADYYEQRDRVYRPSTAPRAADLQAEFQLTPITFRSPTGEPLMDVPRRLARMGRRRD